MLPFEQRPWARQVAGLVIVITLVAAVLAPIYLHHIRHLDPPMIVLIALLVLAIVPPNVLILRRRRANRPTHPARPDPARPAVYASRHSGS
ncbi:MAG: hypothetical protein M3O02_03580 [Acidobacteriota bacterium]|nr:hypothetical protein [Acidobacteriota bacterium]